MFWIIISALVIALVASALAAALVFCESKISNYGECEIDINQGKKTLTVTGGSSLLSSLIEENVFIPSACGGRGTCGYCKVKVLEGAPPLLPTETPFLTKQEIEQNIRLSCQIKVKGQIKIEIPQQLLSVKKYQAICTEIQDLTYDIKQFRFEIPPDQQIEYKPGQYIQLLTPQYPGNNEEVYRAYSISSNPSDTSAIELIIRKVPNGICTTWCFEHLKQGDQVIFNGPYGDFYLRETNAPIIFIAGGSGMAPIKCILHHMKNSRIKRPAWYFFGARTPQDQYYLDLMNGFSDHLSDFKYIPIVGEDDSGTWKGRIGLVTDVVAESFSDCSDKEAYLCGSPGMINACVEVLVDLGVSEEKIYYDSFS